MRSHITLPSTRPVSAYEAELFARQERARILGELLAEGIVRTWRLIQRVASVFSGKRIPARASAT
jgi:hypothetical protein